METACDTRRYARYVEPDGVFDIARRELAPRATTPLHDHDFHECFWIEHGALLHRVNGDTQPLERGQCVFMRPGDRHALEARGPTACRFVNILFPSSTAAHLSARYADELDGRFFWSATRLPETRPLDGARLARLTRLVDELDAGPHRLVRLERFLLELFTDLLPDDGPPHAADMPPWLIAACRAAREPAVFRRGAAGFVAAAGRSHEHVCRESRRHLGMSPGQYVNDIRMAYASRRLSAGGESSITEIALDCGLANLSHFYRLFRGRYGMTPRAYRRWAG